jgi:hypothetical protein
MEEVSKQAQDTTPPFNGKSIKGLVKELTLLKDLLGTLYVQQNKTVQTGSGAHPTSYSMPGIVSSS